MEEQLKRAIEGQRFETDIDSSNESRGLSMASSGLSPDGISYLLPNTLGDNQYDRVLAIAGLSSESVDLGSSPQKSNTRSYLWVFQADNFQHPSLQFRDATMQYLHGISHPLVTALRDHFIKLFRQKMRR